MRRRTELLIACGLSALLILEIAVAVELGKYATPGQVVVEHRSAISASPIGLVIRDAALLSWTAATGAWRRLAENHDGVIAAATIALFVVTALLALYTYRLWSATAQLARDAKDTSRHELRPYVGLDELLFVIDDKQNPNYLTFTQPSILTLRIRNFGKTPAYSVNLHVLIAYTAGGHTVRPEFDSPVFMGQVLYPEHTQIFAFEPSTFPKLGYSLKDFLVYGKITYFDPVSRVDWSFEFCRQHKGNNQFVPYGNYNNETGIGSARYEYLG
jgi:hypothetical protein